MPDAIAAAYEFRGYKAYGGEMLLIPLFVLLVTLVENIGLLTKEVKSDDDTLASKENCGDEDRVPNLK